MSTKRLVIAGTHSGVGKTTLTIGIMEAMKRNGLTVQGFKCGPDYIDPSYQTAVSGRVARNLDSWMFDEPTLKEVLLKGSQGADISIIEGVMGFYDGKDPTSDEGSTAHISMVTESPVILVVDCGAMARSSAAIIKGFQTFNKNVRIVGVIANRVGSIGHYELIKQAVEQECGIPVVGYLPKQAELAMPERHLGLIPSIEQGDLTPFFQQLGKVIGESVEIDQLYELAEAKTFPREQSDLFAKKREPVVKIAVARDAAFNFYYEENLELLRARGAELVFFSPLTGEKLPESVDGLYIGGGFPEEYAETLSTYIDLKQSLKSEIEKGLPTFAECGGFMFLCDSIMTSDKVEFDMVGVIPGKVTMTQRLAAIGYRETTGLEGNFLLNVGEKVKGHEFHYSTFTSNESLNEAFESTGRKGTLLEGVQMINLVAGYTHLHFASNLVIVDNWINKCLEWKSR
ncbi:cobyrinic acid a,c-diamide synthase [Salipaludibacillus keqinensis]|uniref:Cobyrinate a,c-diamide synthase n=1 Tax=Salipaludibacillus keqinensis TaxID=2045207 RepID=A0A323TF38_9BACI|nr:cobyrinate a,c-diamide synthase [Salipaludibacillus keqinensis]PYZ92307.1 cobyrinic acid a,c-diamide synthase [Salipaludibacillus keqinensis]